MSRIVVPLRFAGDALVMTFALGPLLAAQAPVQQVPPPSDGTYTSQPYNPPPPENYPPPGAGAAGLSPFEPPGVSQAVNGLTSQPASHVAFTFDRDMLQGIFGNGVAGLNSVTVQNYRYQAPAFYVPEAMQALEFSYHAAGWKHLVEANVLPREQVSPQKPITDVWLHYRGAEIDDMAVLIRAPRQLNLVEVSGLLRPLDLLHLGGHFGIPHVDPDAVMVPAPPGR